MKLLIVDDSSVVRRAIERDLESGEIKEVDQAATGEEAVKLYTAKLHDVVTLDITMPGMDGFQVIGHIRQQATLKELPIFVMTGKTLTEQELAILGKDTQAFFHKGKPWQQQLIAEINRVIQGRRAKAAGQR